MKTISFISLKGGVGKTASALSVAQELARRGNKVLLVDLDPQNAATSHFVNSELLATNVDTVRGILKGESDAMRAARQVWETPGDGSIRHSATHHDARIGRIDLIPSEIELSLIEHELGNVPNRELMLHEALQLVATRYEYCVIDTPPALGFLTYSAAIASDVVVIPSQMEKWAVRAIGTTLQGLELCRKSQRYIGNAFHTFVLPTFWSERNSLYATVFSMVRELYGEYLTAARIPGLVEVKKTFAVTGAELPDGKARTAYAGLTEILAGPSIRA